MRVASPRLLRREKGGAQMAWRKSDAALSALFGASIPPDPRIEKRAMFGCPAALVDGKLFGCVHQESFVLKFSEQDRAALRDEFDAHGYEFTSGRGIRDFVAMPDDILSDRDALRDWIARSIAYVAAKPKKSSRPRSDAQKAARDAAPAAGVKKTAARPRR